MKIHRFYIENIDINDENKVVTNEIDLIHQLKNVFRYKIGQKIHLFNEMVGEIEVEILTIDKKDMSFKYNRHINQPDLYKGHKKEISLYMSIIKNSNFDMVIEKAVELGVFKVIPVISERVIKNKLNYERLNKIVKEATEQSGRIQLMCIEETMDLSKAISLSKEESDIVYYGAISKNKNYNHNISDKSKKISIFIGPEGGFSDTEIALFTKESIQPIHLGEYVLRAETAAIVGCGLLSL
jgi:16S rRNA (uracil1498-N3)-methyltransferase